ncbi:EAL domain-containing protein [Massilia atriviolacea]|uniref:Bifunctional diguanylate cyclase/phosphodiesterase n=2 Tax=Massilia atriviolacea TaxID=2495579 RepID=A0A430HHP9_9BURK|nr:bifunctional diguanylate cyclase/phosphodiesterase [Massilia atriviolacea]
MMASYTAINLTGRVVATRGRASVLWLAGGALAMGCGIWSMHFIGMLAFSLPIRMSYDIGITMLSLLVAIGVSAFALRIVTRASVSRMHFLVGGLLMGIGICGMHYMGMHAMNMSPAIGYDAVGVAASAVIAVLASIVALWLAFTLRAGTSWVAHAKKAGAAVLMGLAIIVMHYTGMEAARFDAASVCTSSGGLDGNWLALLVGVAAVSLLTMALLLSVVDSRLATRTASLVSSLRRANRQLHHQALHDSLTRLPNRSLLEDRILQAIHGAERSGKRFALMFLDLDRFKTINDSLGHQYGDKLLQAVAARLSGCLRANDTVARLGGDEFVVLLGEVGAPAAVATVAQKMLDTIALPLDVEGQVQSVSASIGISMYPDDGASLRELMTNADSAMYHAKKVGRANHQFFAPAMNAAAGARLALERALRQALENQEFELHYQPKVDVASGAVVAMEALLRWRCPQRGMVPPSDFIGVSEEIGLIIPLGAWVLREACRQNRAWQLAGMAHLRMAVNLSAYQFRQKDLPEFVAAVLKETGMDASCLELEVTESVVMHNPAEAAQILDRLHAQGIHISVDDFGTGYSSLSYLKQFRLDTLKIDRSFVRDISSDADDAAIVRSVIALAHSLRLQVIAEGVETEEQLAYLRELGCDQYQGYLRSKPLPAAQFEALLRSGAADTPAAAPKIVAR